MELFVLRHGIAAERETWVGKDAERPLTATGRRKMERIARGMEALGLSFGLILASPFVRARQTAEVVAAAFRLRKRLELAPALAVGGNPRELLAALSRRQPQPESVLLVGHEPYLSGLTGLLISGRPRATLTLKKGGLAKLTVEELAYGRGATLEWLLTPGQLVALS